MDTNYDKLCKDKILAHILSSLSVRLDHEAKKCLGACKAHTHTLDDWRMILVEAVFEVYDRKGGQEQLSYYFEWASGAAWREVYKENRRLTAEEGFTRRQQEK
jgi:hypothetical protein